MPCIRTRRQRKYACYRQRLQNVSIDERGCVDRHFANGRAAGKSDARNCHLAAPVNGERVTEPSGAFTQKDQERFPLAFF